MLTILKKLLSAAMFSQADDLIRQGKRSHLQFEDLPALPPFLNPRNAPARFLSLSLRGPWRFLFDVLRALGPRFGGVFALLIAMIVFGTAAPLAMNQLVSGLGALIDQHSHATSSVNHVYTEGLLWALGFSLLIFLRTVSIQHYFYQVLACNQLILSGINRAIYAKSLRLSLKARRNKPIGDIINHMGSDTHLIAELPIATAEIVYSVGIITASTAASVSLLGVSAFAGLTALILALPICLKVANKFVKLDEEVLKHKDKRASIMSQLVSGIRIVKFLCWEKKAEFEVTEIRERELEVRWRLLKTWAASDVVFGSARLLAIICAIAVVVAIKGDLSAAKIFACMALFDLWHHPLSHMSGFVADVSGARVAAGRLISFFNEHETGSKLAEGRVNSPAGLCISKLYVGYHSDLPPVLKNWDLNIAPGSSTVVVGAVGSGKTTFLLTLLGELNATSGKVVWNNLGPSSFLEEGSEVKGSEFEALQPAIAFVPQSPYILNSSVRANIEFGKTGSAIEPFVRAAALDEDVSNMSGGFDTEIGEQGINLSGGQKQRLNLARACNSEASVVLMDDPFAAVDQKTELHLIEELIFGAMQGKTRIVTSHRLDYLGRFDQIIFVDDGAIRAVGTLAGLQSWSPEFKAFYSQHHAVDHQSRGGSVADSSAALVHLDTPKSPDAGVASGKLVFDEDRESGSIEIRLYWEYLCELAGGARPKSILALMFASTLAAGVLPLMQSYWLTAWTAASAGTVGVANHDSSPMLVLVSSALGSNQFNLSVFALLAVATVLITWGRQLVWFSRSIVAGRSLHLRALKSMLSARILFFDRNPVGRILNRFSSDVDAVERTLASAIEQMVSAAAHALLALGMVLLLSPYAVFAIVPVLILFWRLQHSYRCTGRETKRLNSISRSPRFAHFKETVEGLESIRAFGREESFWDQFYARLELNQRSFHAMVLANRWFSVRLPVLTAVVTLTAVSGAIFSVGQGKLSPAQAALLMFLAANLSDHLNWVVRSFSEAESWMTAFERIRAYGRLDAEPERVLVESSAVAKMLPVGKGHIEFNNFYARYAPGLPHALKGIDLKIPSGTKVGVMGRTGSGKSTLIQALYRMIDGDHGRITIDGVDTRQIALSDLRKRLAIIPQTPTLFQGTLRQNLDRYDAFNDTEIWSALDQVQMGHYVRRIPGFLEASIAENGNNFSLGQKQLLCLARAILTDASVIIMDEATASIDVVTDELVQQTIRTAFADRTMIIIAHRLGTIRHCDQIIEMSGGMVS